MQKVYSRINWENEPSTDTPINENNLNAMDSAIDLIDDRVCSLYGYEEIVKGYRDEAKGYRDESSESASASATSEANASDSEVNAKQSENNAKASETASATSEANAENSSKLAKSYAVGTNGVVRTGDETDNAKYYSKISEDNANASETSKDNAKISEDNAKQSESNAKTSELNAKASEEECKQIKDTIGSFVSYGGSLLFEDLPDLSTLIKAYNYNITNEFISDSRFTDGGGIKYPSGTNVVNTADGFWDVQNGVYQVDSTLDSTSANPPENRIVKDAIDGLDVRVKTLEEEPSVPDNVAILKGESTTPTPTIPRDADTLQGHSAEYFATAEDVNNKFITLGFSRFVMSSEELTLSSTSTDVSIIVPLENAKIGFISSIASMGSVDNFIATASAEVLDNSRIRVRLTANTPQKYKVTYGVLI